MKRYLIKTGFSTLTEFEKAKTLLIDCGVDRNDIDYISFREKEGKGLKFKKETKGPKLSLRFFILGVVLGAGMYFFSLFHMSPNGFWDTLLLLDTVSLLLTTLITAVVFLFVGYLVGKKYSLHTVSYKDEKGGIENILMTVNIDLEYLERAKQIFSSIKTKNIEINDTKKEVAIGLRSQ